MNRKPGHSNWGKPDTGRRPPLNQTSFEETVKAMKLSPREFAKSAALKEWVRKNKDHKYVPPDLLKIWDFEVRGE